MNIKWLFDTYPFIKNEKITLCKPQPTEGDAIIELFSDEELVKLSRRTLKLDNYNISSFFRQMEISFTSKRSLLLGIFKNDNINELLGVIIIDNLDVNTESMDIDLYLRKKYRNKNLAVAALNIAVSFLFERVELKRIAASALAENKVYEDILLSSGFTKEGVCRRGVYLQDKGVVSMAYYSFISDDLIDEDMETDDSKDYYL